MEWNFSQASRKHLSVKHNNHYNMTDSLVIWQSQRSVCELFLWIYNVLVESFVKINVFINRSEKSTFVRSLWLAELTIKITTEIVVIFLFKLVGGSVYITVIS